MKSSRILSLALLACALFIGTSPCLTARSSEWTDERGEKFKGEPVEVLGPFALFRRGPVRGKIVPLRAFSPEDCVRLYREVGNRPPPAADWSAANGSATDRMPGRVWKVAGEKLEPVDLAGRPEPSVLVVLYGSHNEGESWRMINDFAPTYERIQRLYPGVMETVFFGLRHDNTQHRQIAVTTRMPWLIADLQSQQAMNVIARLAPGQDRLMLAITRDGVPITSSLAQNGQAVMRFVDELADFLRAIDPKNPRAGRDRLIYANAVRPVQFASGSDGPLLVSNPLRGDALRDRGVLRLRAHLEVGADGRASAVVVDPGTGVPAELVEPLAHALAQGLQFSPAIQLGKPVPGTFDFALDLPEQDPVSPGDRVWMLPAAPGSLPLTRWLLLKPVSVPEQNFSGVDHVDEEGTVVMKEVRASTGTVSRTMQMNAFNTDWFTAAGAGSVAPVEGATQIIDGEELTWRAVNSNEGHVDLQAFERRDYCIGYAWTELEMPEATSAWLGIGSDDGLKIWLNGELIHDKWIRRLSRVDDDIVPMKLRAGKNRILIKIQNATGDWSFICRLRAQG